MKLISKLALTLASTLTCIGSIYAAFPVSNADDTTTFLGPTGRLALTRTFTKNAAYSFAGEFGAKDFRLGATLGWYLTDNQRVKISGEYLWQDITYAFLTGNKNEWVSQGALGATYQFDFDYRFNPRFDLSAYVSHAPSRLLSSQTVNLVYSDQTINPVIVDRRIAGSNAAGITPGIAMTPWVGGTINAGLNYDNVRYDRRYEPEDNAIGLGGRIGFQQAITNRIGFGINAEIRQPFNNYTANLIWTTIPNYTNWALALSGNYLVGKEDLPNTWNLGLSVNYLMDTQETSIDELAAKAKQSGDVKAAITVPKPRTDLLAWTGTPAVYMPQVLAVADQRVTSLCTTTGFLPSLISPIPDAIGNQGVYDPTTDIPRSFNSPTHFSGNNLTYAITSITAAPIGGGDPSVCYIGLIPPQIFAINPTTGVVTLTVLNGGGDCIWSVTVQASNECSAVADTFDVEIDV